MKLLIWVHSDHTTNRSLWIKKSFSKRASLTQAAGTEGWLTQAACTEGWLGGSLTRLDVTFVVLSLFNIVNLNWISIRDIFVLFIRMVMGYILHRVLGK